MGNCATGSRDNVTVQANIRKKPTCYKMDHDVSYQRERS